VYAVQAPGHSPGMVAHLVTYRAKQFLISADVSILTHISTNPEWQLAIDQDPQMAVETRKRSSIAPVADKLTISGTHWFDAERRHAGRDATATYSRPRDNRAEWRLRSTRRRICGDMPKSTHWTHGRRPAVLRMAAFGRGQRRLTGNLVGSPAPDRMSVGTRFKRWPGLAMTYGLGVKTARKRTRIRPAD